MDRDATKSISNYSLPRRHFMKGLASGVLGAVVAGSTAGRLALAADAPAPAAAPPAPPTGPFKLPPLTYDYAALEPSIDALTMKIHHDKHHQAYINNLNIAVKGHPDLAAMSVEELLKSLDKVPEPIRMAVRNNAGGHANHTLFWTVMGPGKGGAPTGKLLDAINGAFGNFADFKKQFSDAAIKRFGSGWAWLNVDGKGKLTMESLPNQDSPISAGKKPILGLDVWEHAYYLKYQNKRPDYVAAWWNTVNWDAVGDHYDKLA